MNKQYRDLYIMSGDTETPGNIPSILTLSNDKDDYLYDVTPKNIFDKFIGHLRRTPAENIVLFFHNLYYDMTVLLNQILTIFCDQEFKIEYEDIVLSFFNDHPYFGEIKFKNGKTVHLRDTFAFFTAVKLNALADSLGLGLHKKEIPDYMYLDVKYAKNKLFREYAIRDTRITYQVGCRIMDFHKMDDIPLCVSGPQMSMEVFKKHFMPYNGSFPPVKKGLRDWELSCHGGENGCYVQTPCELKNISLYDFNSAYPYAMTQIPNFMNCEYIHEKARSGNVGIYCISGESKCFYNSTFEHNFKPTKQLRNTWITSYELESLCMRKEISGLKIHDGWTIKENETYNPLKEFALHYYKLKNETPKGTPLYLYYKTCILNALSGKFIERRYPQGEEYSIRGPNYNPAIYTLITGHCRARLHNLSHKLKAIHCATDSVFTEDTIKTSKELGGLSLEGKGTLRLLRTKLYMFYNKSKLIKYALHGFHGNVHQLEELWKKKKSLYTYNKIPKVKEFIYHKNLNLKMFGMNKMKSVLNVDLKKIVNHRINDNNLNKSTKPMYTQKQLNILWEQEENETTNN